MLAATEAPGIDLGAAIDSGLDEIAAENNIPGGEETPGTDEGQQTDGVIDGTSEYAAPEPATPETTEAPATPQASDGPYPLSQDGNGYVVPKQDYQTLDGLKQYAEAVQNRFPTANDAEVAYAEAMDLRSMITDYVKGDPQSIDFVLNHWAGAGETDPTLISQFQRSFVSMANKMPEVLSRVNPQAYGQYVTDMASKMPEMLKQTNPQAYEQFRSTIAASEIKEAYDRAAQTGDPDDFTYAQRLDWGRNGRYETELPKHDPEAAARTEAQKRQQDFERQQNELQQKENSISEQYWKNFDSSSVNGPKWAAYNAEIDRTLAPIKNNYSEPVFEALREKVSKDLINKLQEDAQWAAAHNNAYESIQAAFKHAWKNNQPPTALNQRTQFYNNDFMTRVTRNLPSVVKKIMEAKAGNTNGTKPAPQAQTPRTQPAAQKPALQTPPAARPNGQARPPQQQAPGKPAGWDAAFK